MHATCPYPLPARSSPYPHIPLPEDPYIILPSTPESLQRSTTTTTATTTTTTNNNNNNNNNNVTKLETTAFANFQLKNAPYLHILLMGIKQIGSNGPHELHTQR